MNQCRYCDAPIPARSIVCKDDPACKRRFNTDRAKEKRERNEAEGIVCHCGKGVQAKGMCQTHYNQSRRDIRGRENTRPTLMQCAGCGEEIEKVRHAGRSPVCSLMCRYFVTFGRWQSQPWPMIARTPRPPKREPLPRPIRSGECLECGAQFATTRSLQTYCSRDCKDRASKFRRRAVKVGAFVAPVHRQAIYERDKWTCQLCGKKIKRNAVAPHPLSATIDHVIPLRCDDRGTHEPANCQTAHFLCNSSKGARGGGEQLALIG